MRVQDPMPKDRTDTFGPRENKSEISLFHPLFDDDDDNRSAAASRTTSEALAHQLQQGA